MAKKKYRVSQLMNCVVRVWYEIESDSFDEVINKVAQNKSPTDKSIDGTDYEIIEDLDIFRTVINEVDNDE